MSPGMKTTLSTYPPMRELQLKCQRPADWTALDRATAYHEQARRRLAKLATDLANDTAKLDHIASFVRQPMTTADVVLCSIAAIMGVAGVVCCGLFLFSL